MASAFIPPVILNTQIVEGSLRQEAEKLGVSVIVYEAGEALRFNEVAIRAGVRGVDSVMREIGMLPIKKARKSDPVPVVATDSSWIRAPHSGILRMIKPLGARVSKNEVLGIISDPFGDSEHKAIAPFGGIIIGKTNLPLVNEGEALFHVARFESISAAASQIEEFQAEMDPLTDDASINEPAIS
jgi:predicted deacylase